MTTFRLIALKIVNNNIVGNVSSQIYSRGVMYNGRYVTPSSVFISDVCKI